MVSCFDELGTTLYALGTQEATLKQIKERTPEQDQQLAAIKEQIKQVNKKFSVFLDDLHEVLPKEDSKIDNIDIETNRLIRLD